VSVIFTLLEEKADKADIDFKGSEKLYQCRFGFLLLLLWKRLKTAYRAFWGV